MSETDNATMGDVLATLERQVHQRTSELPMLSRSASQALQLMRRADVRLDQILEPSVRCEDLHPPIGNKDVATAVDSNTNWTAGFFSGENGVPLSKHLTVGGIVANQARGP